ncbi:related to Replication factor C subunit 1 [Saccharomycodes ludwigii]|uniref:Replication factor C subunit 1 n=1 Tax=Saccharomycodes ludwigii TaxID=36035 RepID=A0A376B3S8_9ASCO|nr:hypothetical protein SCDLUD_002097 [Saccharomycodes ludwigii]KAH3902279.1 hypothetical protein SCDLUD_002097 [Saccharomycodes ludwigii]SSD59338.1 related to Replication factor C subunit 1 [Saccharomycodes ludwigii]
MVDISEFFGKKRGARLEPSSRNKKRSTTTSKVSSKKHKSTPSNEKKNTLEAIDILNDPDEEQNSDNSLIMIKESSKIDKPTKNASSHSLLREKKESSDKGKARKVLSPPPKIKDSKLINDKKSISTPSKNNYTSVNELLMDIPSVDLDNVNVKDVHKYDFLNQEHEKETSMQQPPNFPEGAPECLLGLTIVFTGILPNLSRPEAENIAKKYGAKVTKAISRKTSVVVLGNEAGPTKVQKIKDLKIKVIDEDGFKQLVSGMPKGGGDSIEATKAREKKKKMEEEVKKESEKLDREERENFKRANSKLNSLNSGGGSNPINNNNNSKILDPNEQLWTVKYAPKRLGEICGNKSSVQKLKTWLEQWPTNAKNGFKYNGLSFRAAMLSGPPGIGKTTAAHLVAKELGYDILEKNASDVRSKSLLNETVKNTLDNTSVVGFFKPADSKNLENQNKFVIIMDEVDGMSGGDRGGVGQLAAFCRKTATPMILICNERRLPKMRPFDKVCLEVQFRRPDATSIKSRLLTIAFREKFEIDAHIIDNLVQATRGDIRQIINLLSNISSTTKKIGAENINEIAKSWEKDVALKPFDITQQLFSGSIYTPLGSSRFPLWKKMELYFDDIDFTPLMIQENYLNTRPTNLKNGMTHLQAVAEAANDVSLGDLVDKKIHSSAQLWSLLPFHSIISTILPASLVSGQMAGRINFSAWLGQNSKTGKYYRMLQELYYHTRLSTSTDKDGFRLDYIPTLKNSLLNPLLTEGSTAIPDIIHVMDGYYLSKDDWDSIMEFMVGPDVTEPLLKKIPAAVKSSFTRKYNATTHPVSIYTPGTTSFGSAKKDKPDLDEVVDADDNVPPPEDDQNKSTEDDEIDFKKDKLIKQAKPRSRKVSAIAKSSAGTKKRKVVKK